MMPEQVPRNGEGHKGYDGQGHKIPGQLSEGKAFQINAPYQFQGKAQGIRIGHKLQEGGIFLTGVIMPERRAIGIMNTMT